VSADSLSSDSFKIIGTLSNRIGLDKQVKDIIPLMKIDLNSTFWLREKGADLLKHDHYIETDLSKWVRVASGLV